MIALLLGDLGSARLAGAAAAPGRDATVAALARPEQADHELRTAPPSVFVFDASAVERDYFRRLRREHPAHAIVAWLPSASSESAAELLADGADEVVHGGMSDRELLLRVRKAAAPDELRAGRLEVGELQLDLERGDIRWGTTPLRLTRREREVLFALAESAPNTVRREVLYRRVWGYAMARGDRSVDVNVKRLRAKLAQAGAEVEIRTEPGVGYRLLLTQTREPVTAL